MTIVIDDGDLLRLQSRFPELDFSDAERKAVLTSMASIDVQAVPGSGKTTLLAVKLALIASKWQHASRGVCVLSHTNVAREEIEQRLSRISDGQRLLAHPHFIGTIQTFVHTFLALSLLRSRGMSLDVIDDEYFAEKAMRAAAYKWNVKVWLKHQPNNAEQVIKTLTFQGADLDIGCVKGSMPKSSAKSHPELHDIKKELTGKGIFRYDDMFAFAKHVLANYPSITEAIRHRFPFVFLDEMQDTDNAQEALLTEVFGSNICIQRYGDISQQIMNDSAAGSLGTFPKSGFLNVATSKRFGSEIAAVASRLRVTGNEIIGEGASSIAVPTILLYDDNTIHGVIPSFGKYVAELFSAEELIGEKVKAVCYRKNGESKKGLGRHIVDYFPEFDAGAGKPVLAKQSFISAIRDVSKSRQNGEVLTKATHLARSAILQTLRQANSPHTSTARGWRDFVIASEQKGVSVAKVNEFVRTYVLSPPETATEDEWNIAKSALFSALSEHLPDGLTEQQFSASEYLAYLNAPTNALIASTSGTGNQFRVFHAGKSFTIDVSTIAGVKGETHLATLVLESFLQTKFDVESALKYLCGEACSMSIEPDNLHKQMRNLFVGMTRPTRLLCVAMHRSRLSPEYEDKLTRDGWKIRPCK
ncbi:MAG: UvrD-helicase domain-containing protein [Methylophilaceae bacterium]|nr:UvrD-helicase domain-containing protein [Methylophilaceae bacterium]